VMTAPAVAVGQMRQTMAVWMATLYGQLGKSIMGVASIKHEIT
jgi:hypothetical protein